MEKTALFIGKAFGWALALVIILPMSCSFGALSGWVVSFIWGQTIQLVLTKLGLPAVELWQLGATLGFVSAFLRTKVELKRED